MRVDYGELALLSQVLTRQEQHAQAIEGYIRQNCSLSPQRLGLLLMGLYPAAEGAVLLGSSAVGLVGGLSRWAADTAESNLDAYVEADSAAYDEFATIMDQRRGRARG
ncbi:MAG: hypothetical protein KF680_09795 [Cryobacterium sp.]|nr:hypothetical protein [Cryobacterium sp.]